MVSSSVSLNDIQMLETKIQVLEKQITKIKSKHQVESCSNASMKQSQDRMQNMFQTPVQR